MKHTIMLFVLLSILMLQGVSVANPYVTATYRPIDAGYRLEFEVHADPARGFYEWGLFTTALTDIVAPPNWWGGVGVRETAYISTGPDYVIRPGRILYGCAASVLEQPGTMYYYIMQTGPGPGPAYTGTVTPTLVPEPSSLLTLGGGLFAVGIPWLRRRVHKGVTFRL